MEGMGILLSTSNRRGRPQGSPPLFHTTPAPTMIRGGTCTDRGLDFRGRPLLLSTSNLRGRPQGFPPLVRTTPAHTMIRIAPRPQKRGLCICVGVVKD